MGKAFLSKDESSELSEQRKGIFLILHLVAKTTNEPSTLLQLKKATARPESKS